MAGLIQGECEALVSRHISEDTCKHFGYMKGKHKGRNVQIAPYYNADGEMVAQKLRYPDKTFAWLGDAADALPFGATKFPKSGKMIVVTEGEIDALAMSQVQGNKWPVVSIACGADLPFDKEGNPLPMTKIKKYFAKHREYFKNFEKVVLMFDMDAQGKASARAAAEILGPRARIADLPRHDAADCLKEGLAKEMLGAMWAAVPHRPEGIVELSTLREQVMKAVEWGLPWPWPKLTQLTYGRRYGEVYAIGAGAGTGKTDFYTQVIEQTVRELGLPVGVFSLEQAPKETALRIAGKHARKRFHVPDAGWTQEELESTWESLIQTQKVFLYDSFGINDWDVIEDRIRFLHAGEGVRHFFIDHLTALATGNGGEERVILEELMAKIGALVKELDICIYLVSHLATPEGKPHEEGGRVYLRHLKGSRAIGFWCHFAFGLERDQQAEDPIERRTTTLRVLKDRYTGQATGETIQMLYDTDTGMLGEKETSATKMGFENESDQKSDF